MTIAARCSLPIGFETVQYSLKCLAFDGLLTGGNAAVAVSYFFELDDRKLPFNVKVVCTLRQGRPTD